LLFGVDGAKGLRIDPATLSLEVIDATARANEVAVHDETNPVLAQLLLAMQPPQLPVALGVIRRDPGPSYEQAFIASHVSQLERTKTVAGALRETNVWRVG